MNSPPTKTNSFGVIKVKQYHYSEFIKASNTAKEFLLEVGIGLIQKTYPAVVGVELQKMPQPFECKNGEI